MTQPTGNESQIFLGAAISGAFRNDALLCIKFSFYWQETLKKGIHKYYP